MSGGVAYNYRRRHQTWITTSSHQGTMDTLRAIQHKRSCDRNILIKIVLSSKFQAFLDLLNGEGTNIERNWKGIKEAINSTCHEVLGHKKHHHKEWITVDTLKKIQERRNKKAAINTSRTRGEEVKAQSEYTELNKQVTRIIRTDKRKYVEDLAMTVEKIVREENILNTGKSFEQVFTHGDDVGQMAFLPPLGRSDHAVILSKFLAGIACQTVAPARPNIWKADMQAINSAASAENLEIDSKASVQEAWTLFRQLYNRVNQPYIAWTVTMKKKHGHPWIGQDIRRLLRQK
ncbi:unnamed protein product [Schistosoma curassoni]|uniref:Myb_DNA-bind_3 domain-containing protein n=1 Tax=Schistosoma curassoni TaxID=6186 RepID=A0A183KWU9_9TREM|nr:unnamed protein product [Schistosoma curassoni]